MFFKVFFIEYQKLPATAVHAIAYDNAKTSIRPNLFAIRKLGLGRRKVLCLLAKMHLAARKIVSMPLDMWILVVFSVFVVKVVVVAETAHGDMPVLVRKSTLVEQSAGSLNDRTIVPLYDPICLVSIGVVSCLTPSTRYAASNSVPPSLYQ